MKKALLFVIIILLTFLSCGCVYYSYAASSSVEDGFRTILFQDSQTNNCLDVSITHLTYDSYYAKYQAYIILATRNLSKESVLQINNIKIVLRHKNCILSPLSEYKSSDENKITLKPEEVECYIFQQDYDAKVIEKNWADLQQDVILHFMWNGKEREIKRTFVLERRKHFSKFDEWMNSI
jgi:hypothetical protein